MKARDIVRSEMDIAYIAGLFDGEGIYTILNDRRRRKNIKAKVIESLIVYV